MLLYSFKYSNNEMRDYNIKISCRTLKAISSESGIKIFAALSQVKEMCVSDIARRVKLSISAASHQLHKMESAGLIDSWRDGRTVCFSLGKNKFNSNLANCLRGLINKRQLRQTRSNQQN